MTYYIIYFTEKKMYLRSSKLLIHSEEGAKKYFSASTARRAARNSSFSEEPFEIIAVDIKSPVQYNERGLYYVLTSTAPKK